MTQPGSPAIQLYYSRNLNPRVAVAVARHLESPVELIAATPRAPGHETGFLSLNPNGLVPVLVEDGQSLWETDAIAARLSQIAGSQFWRNDSSMPQMIRWISWATHHLNAAASVMYWENIIKPTYLNLPADPEAIASGMADFRRHARVLDTELQDRQWLVGDTLSYADFRTATALPFAEPAGLPLNEFPNITRWNTQLLALDAWRDPFAGLETAQ